MVLICIFILIDFSENSDEFTNKGAAISEVWNQYYLNYIPEMIRLVSPLAVFIACLIITGQMTERLEITALKASGVSLYRLVVPYLIFGILLALSVSYLDAFIIPNSNAERIEFEKQYLGNAEDRLDRGRIFRQESDSTIVSFNYFEPGSNTGYQATVATFNEKQVKSIATANRVEWNDSLSVWNVDRYRIKTFSGSDFEEMDTTNVNLDLNLLPGDLARRSSDIYQLTYPEAFSYIESISRIGAGGLSLPRTQLFSRIAYPMSIFVVCLIGFALATERRKAGRGFYIAAGLAISIIYLAFMKIIEPFGAAGTISPEFAAFVPHSIFFGVGIILLLLAKK